MKKIVMALALAVAPLSACTTTEVLQNAPVIGNVCAAADRTFVDEKVVFAAETVLNIAADAYIKAFKAGELPVGPLQRDLKAKVIKLESLRNAVVAAKGTVNCDFEAMKDLQAEILSLIPRK